MAGCIVGWAHTHFGKLDAEDIESLIGRVTREAIADAGIEPSHIADRDLDHYGGGFVRERFLSSMPLQVSEGLRFKPSTRVENACATGSTTLRIHRSRGFGASSPCGANAPAGCTTAR